MATAYNNVALTWMRQGEWRKAQARLTINPNDAKSIYNLGLIKEKLAALPKSDSPAGEYWNYAGLATWETLIVKPTEKNQTFRLISKGIISA